MIPGVRPTAVLIEDGRILLVEQRVGAGSTREWSLPGGRVKGGETIEECLRREVREETGIDIAIERLLYVCDRIGEGTHVVHLTFVVRRVGGDLCMGSEPERDAHPITAVKMVPLGSLRDCGFGDEFCRLAANGFPESGTYRGPVDSIGL